MKYVFSILHLSLIAITAYSSVQIMYKKLGMDASVLIVNPVSVSPVETSRQKQTEKSNNRAFYEPILIRNLFDVLVKEKPLNSSEAAGERKKVAEAPEKTKLQLILLGTVTSASDVYAVIEDKKNREQVLLRKGEKIGDATVLDIQRRLVTLFYDGREQALEMETQAEVETEEKTTSLDHTPVAAEQNPPEPGIIEVMLDQEMMNNTLQSKEGLTNQIKVRPHYTAGQPDGVMVYGIKPDSVFRQIGLQNGDIVKAFDGEPILSMDDIAKLYDGIKAADNKNLQLLRRGQITDLVFSVKNGENTIKAISE